MKRLFLTLAMLLVLSAPTAAMALGSDSDTWQFTKSTKTTFKVNYFDADEKSHTLTFTSDSLDMTINRDANNFLEVTIGNGTFDFNFAALGAGVSSASTNSTAGFATWDTGLDENGQKTFFNFDATDSMASGDVSASYATIRYTLNPNTGMINATVVVNVIGLLTVGTDQFSGNVTFTVSGLSFQHDSPGLFNNLTRPFTPSSP